MKKLLFTFIIALFSLHYTSAQTPILEGAYQATNDGVTELWLFKDNYCTYTKFADKDFMLTWGGPFRIENQHLHVTVEFNSQNVSEVGSEEKLIFSRANDTQVKIGEKKYSKSISKIQGLDGLWRITGRKEGEKVNTIKRGDRKTIKILVDGYFQWIAINPAEKGFYGSGGGTYTFLDRIYTEHLLFFSRDNNRVGATLSFKGEVQNKDWHHSGKSSKGDPIFEIWSRETK
jgi:hypothetical protein